MTARIQAAMLMVALAAAPAFAQEAAAPAAQEPAARPDDRPPVVPGMVSKRLDLNLSLFDAYDLTTLTAHDSGLPVDPRLEQTGSFTGLSGGLSFTHRGRDSSFNALAGSDLRYYTIVPNLLPMDYFGGLNASTTLGRRVTVRGGAAASYSPYYSFGSVFESTTPDQIVTPVADQSVARLNTLTGNASGGLTWTATQKTALDLTYTFDAVDTSALAYRLHSQSAGGALRHRMTRYSELRLGYAYRTSTTGQTGVLPFVAQDIDVGIGYHRPLSFSRRTVVGFDVGSTVVTFGGGHLFFVTGDASLTYQLNRTWATAVYFRRDVGTVGGVTLPFASNAVSGVLGGQWTRKIAVDLGASYSQGGSIGATNNGYHAISGNGRLRFTLSRYVPVYVEYVYYRYSFQAQLGLAPGFPVFINRNGLRGGLSYSLPLIGRRPPR